MAFLDEEEQIAVAEEPERPRRRFGGAERRRQQFLVRRLIAVGVGLAFLILLVIGVRGCLEARSDRGLRNYTQDVGTIMAESEQRGKDFFELFQSPERLSELQLQQRINSLRGASESLLNRAQNLDTPGQMSDAHDAVTLSLRLRRDGLGAIGNNITAATADAERSKAIEAITTQMGSLYASDTLWTQVAAPEITQVLKSEDIEAQDLPTGNFMPQGSATQFLDQTEIVTLLSNISGQEVAAGTHGLGLLQTTLGGTTLSADTATSVPDDSKEVAVEVQNQGESEENGVRVIITISGQELEGTIQKLAAGESAEVKVPLTSLPQPGAETTLEVLVEPVPGESVTDNNEATYTVIFGAA